MASRDAHRITAGRTVSSPPAEVALDQHFDQDGLYALRSAVAAHAGTLGLTADRVPDLVVVAHELASNSVRHGGGSGRLRMWLLDGVVHCEVSDQGPGLADPDTAGHHRPATGSLGGRGLWMIRQLADAFVVRTGPAGSTLTVLFSTGVVADPPR